MSCRLKRGLQGILLFGLKSRRKSLILYYFSNWVFCSSYVFRRPSALALFLSSNTRARRCSSQSVLLSHFLFFQKIVFSIRKSSYTLTSLSGDDNSKKIHLTGAKRGKTRATKSRLVLVLHLIGWECGASFCCCFLGGRGGGGKFLAFSQVFSLSQPQKKVLIEKSVTEIKQQFIRRYHPQLK